MNLNKLLKMNKNSKTLKRFNYFNHIIVFCKKLGFKPNTHIGKKIIKINAPDGKNYFYIHTHRGLIFTNRNIVELTQKYSFELELIKTQEKKLYLKYIK